MIVSWQWIREYVAFEAPVSEWVDRLTMAGFKVESQKAVGDDLAIDVEVTSNRPDCLGHIGLARETAVLFDSRLSIPAADPKAVDEKSSSATSVAIECADDCRQYVARLIRGAKIAASPAWLRQRLEAIGVAPINNVVDITNFVLFECGQPLHAFDFAKLRGRRIVVRHARPKETIAAINQRTYELAPSMCVIADAERPVAVGGVMGGLETEIGPSTREILIEAANFAPRSIRATARKLSLFSDSSYRFERGIDPTQLDWASRRCCQLILDLAGGELLDGPVVAGSAAAPPRVPIGLRFDRIGRLLGIDVPEGEAVRILAALGIGPQGKPSDGRCEFVAPSWRRDVTREIDLIEEVARIHGYERIPQDVPVPLQLSTRSLRDSVSETVRAVLTSAGFFEAVTFSFVNDSVCDLFRPRGDLPKLRVDHPSRKHENVLRQSLVPNLLLARGLNERHGTFNAELFEIAKVYLDASASQPEEQSEPAMIGLATGRPFLEAKGIVESLARRIAPGAALSVRPSQVAQFAAGRGADVYLNDRLWGWLGEIDRGVTDSIDLKDAATVAELDLSLLESNAELVSTFTPLPQFPAIQRDLNFVLDEGVTWDALEGLVRGAGGPFLEQVGFGGQYRGKQIDAGKKSYVTTLSYRAPDRTLTSDEVDAYAKAVIEQAAARLGARLR